LLDLLGARALFQLLQRRLRLIERALRLQLLRVQIARLELEERLARLEPIALAHEHGLDAPARARADGDGARLDGAAPLVRLDRLIQAIRAVDEGEPGDDRERNEPRSRCARRSVVHRRCVAHRCPLTSSANWPGTSPTADRAAIRRARDR